MIKVGTLFSGGLAAPELALKQANIPHKVVFACEIDKEARIAYKANNNIDSEHFHRDVRDLDGHQYRGQVDVIVGGSPCQSFSITGLRKGVEDERGALIYQYARVIEEASPECFVFENVKGFLSIDGGRTYNEFIEYFRSIGYYVVAKYYQLMITESHRQGKGFILSVSKVLRHFVIFSFQLRNLCLNL